MAYIVVPIDTQARRQVIGATESWIRRGAEIFERRFTVIPVTFDLSGRAFGMYRADRRGRCIRFNPYLFAKYYAEGLAETVPHEVGHYITDVLYGRTGVRPHGARWRGVMEALGVEHRTRIQVDLTGVPVRRQRRFTYRCACRLHRLSARAHNRRIRGSVDYRCRYCTEPLIYGCGAEVGDD